MQFLLVWQVRNKDGTLYAYRLAEDFFEKFQVTMVISKHMSVCAEMCLEKPQTPWPRPHM